MRIKEDVQEEENLSKTEEDEEDLSKTEDDEEEAIWQSQNNNNDDSGHELSGYFDYCRMSNLRLESRFYNTGQRLRKWCSCDAELSTRYILLFNLPSCH